ncbi:hypothetical protein EJD97_010883 [Solanum chilense]|uniref:Uncharacterized protein n=1 Tax=Solanum chilense TaxID=4083 RepID=A0A6N2BGS1_SOLCI|nr:hypothetical protein EJD97_010883 [Solanum chilense]
MSMATYCTNENLAISNIENDVFMSFLEEPEFEASDEELLRSVIESLEVENIVPSVNTNDSILFEQMKVENSTNLSCDDLGELEYCWIDSDMDSSTPSDDDDMNIWFKDCYYDQNGVEDFTNFIGACREFSWEQSCESMLYE